jgi:hypothetical protein
MDFVTRSLPNGPSKLWRLVSTDTLTASLADVVLFVRRTRPALAVLESVARGRKAPGIRADVWAQAWSAGDAALVLAARMDALRAKRCVLQTRWIGE